MVARKQNVGNLWFSLFHSICESCDSIVGIRPIKKITTHPKLTVMIKSESSSSSSKWARLVLKVTLDLDMDQKL